MYDELVKRLRDSAKMSEALAILLPHSEGNATAKLYNEAADAIEELTVVVRAQKAVLEKFPKWIPVTERMPEEPGFYIVYTDSSYNHIRMLRYGMAAPVAFRDGNNWYDEKGQHIYSWLVKFWMPLTELPREE